jgi:SET domain-containing protein
MRINPPTKIYVSNSKIHGIGVFASEKINSLEIIEECPIIDMGMFKGESSNILIDYRFNWPQGTMEWEKQVVSSGYGSLYNHSNEPNASWRSNLQNNTFEFYALKDIHIDEEIFVWYGDSNYWNDGRNKTIVI